MVTDYTSPREEAPLPRGVEVLVKKAAVDAAFKRALLSERAAAARLIGLDLTVAEAELIAAIPTAQLDAIVARTRVPAVARAAFMGYAAAAMLAALGALAYGCKARADGGKGDYPAPTGINPDIPTAVTAETAATAETGGTAVNTQPIRGVRGDDPGADTGIRPDVPEGGK